MLYNAYFSALCNIVLRALRVFRQSRHKGTRRIAAPGDRHAYPSGEKNLLSIFRHQLARLVNQRLTVDAAGLHVGDPAVIDRLH